MTVTVAWLKKAGDVIFIEYWIVSERKVRFPVGWVEPLGHCWVSYLNPTYEN